MNTPSADESSLATPDDIAAFVKKLQKWAESLPEAEQPLAQFLVQRARQLQPEDVQAQALALSLKDAIRTVFETKVTGTNWVEIMPLWIKRGDLGGSDARLKRNISKIGDLSNGIGLYRYRYKWSDIEYVGVMAQEVAGVRRDAVTRGADGFLRVNYAQLGMRLMTWAEWTASQEQEDIMGGGSLKVA